MTPHQKRAEKHKNKHVKVFLTNGVQLTGTITDADEVGLDLTRDGVTQDVFYQAIATIIPNGD